ncbi:ArsC/Spx/MgsR family protein [Pseudooceanicola sp.]|uniref:arsenate reductase family protein n=1 Tax=Pseudooceanicola sp. TaxID=1914328 RepID=UPI00260C09F4|nr:ArsC/Spx/MgsR family protein [Pseudooceanicola sp.]MDF1853996.1 arsenate reductase [Pseudooceanicola sp.]
MIIYGIKTCDTCRKALKSLQNARLHDIRAEGFPPGLLERAEAAFGQDLLNTRSTTWRGLGTSERARPLRDLILAHPTLMKRPLIETQGRLYLGWGAAVQKALLP